MFVDVAEGSYYEEAIDWAVEKGITNGVSSNMFAPSDPCTRAQIVTFMWRAAGSPAPKSISSFTDVPADAFYAKAVAWAVESSITSGAAGEGKFSPSTTAPCAGGDLPLSCLRQLYAVSGSAEFSDVSATAFMQTQWHGQRRRASPPASAADCSAPTTTATRGQIVTFLWRCKSKRLTLNL